MNKRLQSLMGCVLLLAGLGTLGCASKAQKHELRFKPELVVLAPEVRDDDVTWNGASVSNNAEIEPPGVIVVALTGTADAQAVIQSGAGTQQVQDSGGGRYTARIEVPAGARSPVRVKAWLTDARATPPDGDPKIYSFRVKPPPPPQVEDPKAALRKQAAADLAKIDRIYFAADTFEVAQDSDAILEAWAKVVKSYTQLDFVIVGSCDEIGTDDYNRILGLWRAIHTKTALTALGADGKRIGVFSQGRVEQNCKGTSGEKREECRKKDRWADLRPAGRP